MKADMGEGIVASTVQLLLSVGPDAFWLTALVAALAYAVRSARVSGLDARAVYWAGVCAVLGGLWGSHVLVVLQDPIVDPMAFVRVWIGAKSFYGGLGGGAIAALLYLRLRGLPVRAYADAGAPAVALGYAIGRVGCFLNGDDYGTVTAVPWAVSYPPGTEAYAAHVTNGWITPEATASLPVHPAQLYLAALGLLMFIVLRKHQPAAPGGRFCLYALMYGCGRFVLQYFRGDVPPVLGPLSLPQLCSVVLVLTGVIMWMRVHGLNPRFRLPVPTTSGAR